MALVTFPRQFLVDANGTPRVGAKATFYAAGTTTAITTYTTPAYSTPHANPVLSVSSGYFPAVYVNPSVNETYKMVITDSADASVYTEDDIPAFGSEPFYGRTDAEIAASVTPVSASIPSHESAGVVNVFRYMTAAQIADVVGRAFTLDVSGAIQTAIDFAATLCIASFGGGATVYGPAGTYRMDSGVTIPNTGNLRIRGAGKLATIFKASGTYSKMFTIGDLLGQTIRGGFDDLQISGDGATVQFGIYGARVEEHDFNRIWCHSFATAGASIGYGYVNNYNQCEFSYNTGDGLVFNTDYASGGNNANHLVGCLLFANDGFGLRARGGHGLFIDGCTIEVNKRGGIYLDIMDGVKITGYFEKNGVTVDATPDGHTFTTPSREVKAHIILNGSGVETEMSAAFPCRGVEIGPCLVDSHVGTTCFVWNAGGVDVDIHHINPTNNNCPVLGMEYNNNYTGQNVKVRQCSGFDTQVSILGATSAINNTVAAYIEIDDANDQQARNYAQTDFNQWGVISAGSSATWRRSQAGATRYRLHQADVWELVTAATGSSDILGFAYTAENYPELIGKQLWFGVWVYIDSVDRYIRPWCSEQSFNANPTTLNAWSFLAVSFTWPASGAISFGASKAGTATSGSGYIAAPMLCEVGVPAKRAIGLIQKSRIWYGSAAPTAGAWERGDTVLNTAPSAAGVPGWVCVTAGSPGTWKALAAVAA